MRRHLFLVLAALLAASPVSFAQGTDTVKLATGRELRDRVIDVNYENVVLSVSGTGQQRIALNTVADILFYDTPFGISQGDNDLRNGKLPEALKQYQAAFLLVEQKKVRPLHKQYALYGIARACEGLGKWGEAISAYKRLLHEVPNTRFTREAAEGWMRSAQAKGDKAAIAEIIDVMRKDPKLATMADSLRAELALQAKNYSEARGLFEKLALDPDREVQSRGKAGLIHCLAGEKKGAELKLQCEQAIQGANDHPILRAAAYNALGDLAFAQAESGKDMKLYKEALLLYLRTVVQYFPEGGGMNEDLPHALYQAGLINSKLRDGQKEDNIKKEYDKRAEQLFNELVRDFPHSAWASKVKKDKRDTPPKK
jgi:tetratricopeptide (TPR) repeat protein